MHQNHIPVPKSKLNVTINRQKNAQKKKKKERGPIRMPSLVYLEFVEDGEGNKRVSATPSSLSRLQHLQPRRMGLSLPRNQRAPGDSSHSNPSERSHSVAPHDDLSTSNPAELTSVLKPRLNMVGLSGATNSAAAGTGNVTSVGES